MLRIVFVVMMICGGCLEHCMAQQYVATVFDQQVGVWDVSCNRRGDRWVIAREDKKLKYVLDVRIAGLSAPVLVQMPSLAYAAEFLPDESSIVTFHLGSNLQQESDTLRLWQWEPKLQTYTEVASAGNDIFFFATAPNRQEVVAPTRGGIVRWDGASEEMEILFKGREEFVERMCVPVYSPDGKEIVTGATGVMVRYTFDSDSIQTEKVAGRPHSFAYSPDGTYLASSLPGDSKWSSVVSVRKRQDSDDTEPITLIVDGFWIQHMIFHGDWLVCAGGRHSFATSNRGRKASKPYMVLWNVVTNEQLRLKPPSKREIQRETAEGKLPFRPLEDTIMGIALVSPDRLMVACIDGLVTMWELPPKHVKTSTSQSSP